MKQLQIEECLERMLARIRPATRKETIALEDADGRILAADVFAPRSVPEFPRSAMDGYAAHSADIAHATKDAPARLSVVGELMAGDVPQSGVNYGPGTAVRIMTGAYVPEAYDCVVMQENTDYGTAEVKIYAPVRAWQNYCKRGEDVSEGALLAKAGTRLGAAHIALLASLGLAEATVYVPARIAILSTGSELLEAGAPPTPGKIYNSISYMLQAAIRQQGLTVVRRGLCADDEAALTAALKGDLAEADFVITTGGVSVGKRDLVPGVLKDMGAEILFHGADIQPGTPTLAAALDGKLVLALSGNPYAALANFELYFWDTMAKVMHSESFRPVCMTAMLKSEYSKVNHHRRLLRAHYADGEVRLIDSVHSSSVIHNLTACNCFIDLEAGRRVQVGDTVRVRLYKYH